MGDVKIEEFLRELTNVLTEGKRINENKPWVEEHYNNTFLKEVENVNKWFNEKQEKQSKMELYEDSDFTALSIEDNIYSMRRFLNDMNRIKKPRPPPIDTSNMD